GAYPMTPTTKEVMSRREAAAFIGVSRSTLDRLDVPRVKVRKRVLYRKEAVDKWLLQNQGKEARK
ncbi:MAG: helix-turn-helix domain-containing protein, partial [Treponema sp.]|nr:helix-turn-helix domain-containing protein [Treponema sp.]